MGNTVFDRECQAIQTGLPAMTNTLIKQKRGITMDAQTRGPGLQNGHQQF